MKQEDKVFVLAHFMMGEKKNKIKKLKNKNI